MAGSLAAARLTAFPAALCSPSGAHSTASSLGLGGATARGEYQGAGEVLHDGVVRVDRLDALRGAPAPRGGGVGVRPFLAAHVVTEAGAPPLVAR
jgi:hypothetical protein